MEIKNVQYSLKRPTFIFAISMRINLHRPGIFDVKSNKIYVYVVQMAACNCFQTICFV